MRKLNKFKFLFSLTLVIGVIVLSGTNAIGSPQSTMASESVSSQIKLEVFNTIKVSHQCEGPCTSENLDCFQKVGLMHGNRRNAVDRPHWRKICKIKKSICNKECVRKNNKSIQQ